MLTIAKPSLSLDRSRVLSEARKLIRIRRYWRQLFLAHKKSLERKRGKKGALKLAGLAGSLIRRPTKPNRPTDRTFLQP